MNENVVVKKKNKGVIVLLVILIIIVLGLSAYVVYDKVIEKNNVSEKEENTTTNKEKKMLLKDESKDIVYDLYNESKQEQDTGRNINIKLPYLNINSDYANIINKEINLIYQKQNEQVLIYPYDYSYYINDNILSLIIKTSDEGCYPDYYVYNIDIYNGNSISNLELLDKNGIDTTDFSKNLSSIVVNNIKKEQYYPGQCDVGSDCWILYNSSIEYTNCDIDNDMFLDKDGNLNVVLNLHYYVGGLDAHKNIFNYNTKTISLENSNFCN